MSYCKYCGEEIDWMTTPAGTRIPVDPDPVLMLEGVGAEEFFDDMGDVITGKQARPEEECPELYVAFVPHWRTCRARTYRGR